MRLSVLLASTLFLLSGCIVIPTYRERFSLETTQSVTQPIEMHRVMLVGTGPMASQVFLDNLSTQIKPLFERKGISTEFLYAGKVAQTTQIRLESLVSNDFDACLVFRASDDSHLNMTKEKYRVAGGGAATVSGSAYIGTAAGSLYGNQYKDTYTVYLYKKDGKPQIIWQGHLKLDFDLATEARYKQIAHLICQELITQQLLPKKDLVTK
jgi:hypothetical protein